jgi:hypothetical protein
VAAETHTQSRILVEVEIHMQSKRGQIEGGLTEEVDETDLVAVMAKIYNMVVDRVGQSSLLMRLGRVVAMNTDMVVVVEEEEEERQEEIMVGRLHKDYQMDRDQDDKAKDKVYLVVHDQGGSRFDPPYDLLVSSERLVLLHYGYDGMVELEKRRYNGGIGVQLAFITKFRVKFIHTHLHLEYKSVLMHSDKHIAWF